MPGRPCRACSHFVDFWSGAHFVWFFLSGVYATALGLVGRDDRVGRAKTGAGTKLPSRFKLRGSTVAWSTLLFWGCCNWSSSRAPWLILRWASGVVADTSGNSEAELGLNRATRTEG